jgi:hypothetical protein
VGLGFSPLPYRLRLNSRAPSKVQPAGKQHSRSSVIFFTRDHEPLVETMELSAVNSRECTRSGGHKPQPAKGSAVGIQPYLRKC